MKLPGKGTIASNAIALVFLLFLYVGDVIDFVRARAAEVAAMQQLPNVGFAIAVLAVSVAVAIVVLLAMRRGAPSDSKAFRLLPIVAVVAIFIDLFVLSVDAPIMSSPEHMKTMLQAFARVAHERSTYEHVASSERDLYDAVKEFGAPPYLVKGEPVEAFAIQRRDNCEGPVAEAPGAAVGTFLYCVSKDKKTAWVTVVGLPYEERFGNPKVVSAGGAPLFAIVTPQIPEQAEPPEGPAGDLEPLPDAGDPSAVLMPIDGGL